MIDDFLDWCDRDRNRSPNTIVRYRIALDHLATFGDPMTIDLDAVQRWWESLYGLEPSTRANYLAAARSFYKWAAKFDHRLDDPTRRLDPPKIPIRVPRPIGRSDVDRILGELTGNAPDLRRAFALGVYAGLRVSEAAMLDWSHVDQEQRRIYITGKGDKERVTPLTPLLLDYLLPDTGGNVVAAGGKPYAPGTLQRKINRLLARHEIAHTYHDARKRGATMALARGASIVAVQQVFGWGSMETAAHYAAVSQSEIDDIGRFMCE